MDRSDHLCIARPAQYGARVRTVVSPSRGSGWFPALLLVCIALFVPRLASAQSIGFGGGLAMPSDEVAQLPGELQDRGWAAVQQRAVEGYYLEARARFGGAMALTAAISYNSFEGTVSRFSDPSGSQIDLRTSQVVVPLAIGVERRSEGTLGLVASLEAAATYVMRSYAPVSGSPIPIELEGDGVLNVGLTIGAGASLDLTLVRFDLGARLHLVNLVGTTSTTERMMLYAQLGAIVYLGL